MKGTIAFSGTSMRDNRPAAGPLSFLLLYEITSAVSWLSHLMTKITLKIGNFSDEQGLQNNFNRIYLYNSKTVVKFLTNLSLDVLKKKSTVYEIFRFFRFLIKKMITLVRILTTQTFFNFSMLCFESFSIKDIIISECFCRCDTISFQTPSNSVTENKFPLESSKAVVAPWFNKVLTIFKYPRKQRIIIK
jgi:hypothetical protein